MLEYVVGDAVFAASLHTRIEFAELGEYLRVFQVDALDLVLEATSLNRAPVNDCGRGSALGVAHVGLLVDFLASGACAAVGKELGWGEMCSADFVDDVQEAELKRILHGDAIIQVPWACTRARL